MLTPESFAILPWGWTPGDRETLRGIRECGFNLAGFVEAGHLDRVADAGLKAMVYSPRIQAGDAECRLSAAEIARRVREVVEPTRDHAATFGYYLRDEPGAGVFPGLRKWATAVHRSAPSACAYINLFPNYATPEQLGSADYERHLAAYVKIVRPRFISYDHYALMADGSLRGGYFENLAAVRTVALQQGVPFWNIVLSNAHFHYAEPTAAGLRFQLYTTLAYGGRGISYFTYFTPPTGNYRLAPIDPFGNPTPTWSLLREVNLQLHHLGPTYLQCRSINVIHHEDAAAGGVKGVKNSRYLAELRGGSLLVGEFEGPGRTPYAMVVNKSLRDSVVFHVRFKKSAATRLVNPYTGNSQPWVGENNWLAPGQGMFLYPG